MSAYNQIISDYIKIDNTAIKNIIIDLFVDSEYNSLPNFVESLVQKCGVTSMNLMVVHGNKWDVYMSFSDDNVADGLQRVAGVQIERNVDGVSGDRASIRGIGPQFVRVTLNGRTPISAGNSGRSDLRKFNLNVIPSEIISGVLKVL